MDYQVKHFSTTITKFLFCIGENGFNCNECNMSFNRKNRLEAHLKSVHSIKEEESAFKCSTCDKAFPNSKKLEKHVESHKNNKGLLRTSTLSCRFAIFNFVFFSSRLYLRRLLEALLVEASPTISHTNS